MAVAGIIVAALVLLGIGGAGGWKLCKGKYVEKGKAKLISVEEALKR